MSSVTTSITLLPEGLRPRRTLPRGGRLVRLCVCVAILIGSAGATFTITHGAAVTKNDLVDAKSQLAAVQAQMGKYGASAEDVQASGGAEGLDELYQAAKGRTDYRKLLVALARSTPPGVKLAPPALPAAGAGPLELQGTATSGGALGALQKRLRAQAAFGTVTLKSRSGGVGALQFALTVTLAGQSGAAAPAATSAAPATTSPPAGSPSPSPAAGASPAAGGDG